MFGFPAAFVAGSRADDGFVAREDDNKNIRDSV